MARMDADLYSHVLKRNVHVEMIIPDTLDAEKWRTMILLHGFTDDETMWQRRTAVELFACEKGDLAVIMPTTDLYWYTNTSVGERWFDYVAQELPAAVRRLLPKLSADRKDMYICGLSMGGYGAYKCALTYPETFSMAASLSGAVNIPKLLELDPPLAKDELFIDTFGPMESFKGGKDDVFALAEKLHTLRPRLYMACGSEDFLYDHTALMRDHLQSLEYDLTYNETHGIHEWAYWGKEIRNVIDWIYAKEESTCL